MQHLLRAGQMHVVIVGEAGQRQEPERRDEHEEDDGDKASLIKAQCSMLNARGRQG